MESLDPAEADRVIRGWIDGSIGNCTFFEPSMDLQDP
jgi:hypothetical protein